MDFLYLAHIWFWLPPLVWLLDSKSLDSRVPFFLAEWFTCAWFIGPWFGNISNRIIIFTLNVNIPLRNFLYEARIWLWLPALVWLLDSRSLDSHVLDLWVLEVYPVPDIYRIYKIHWFRNIFIKIIVPSTNNYWPTAQNDWYTTIHFFFFLRSTDNTSWTVYQCMRELVMEKRKP